MTRRSRCSTYAFLLLAIMLGFFLTGCGSSSTSSSYNSSSYNSTNSRRVAYYREYVGQVEWIVVPPQSINRNQTYWVVFPAACLFYTIPGQWALVSSNEIAYLPAYRLDNQSSTAYNSSYIGPQSVTFAKAQAWAADEYASAWDSWDTLIQDQEVSYAQDLGLPDPYSAATGIDDPANSSNDEGN